LTGLGIQQQDTKSIINDAKNANPMANNKDNPPSTYVYIAIESFIDLSSFKFYNKYFVTCTVPDMNVSTLHDKLALTSGTASL